MKLKSNEVLIHDGCIVVARHPRLIHRYTYHDILDHYLVDLLLKPGTFAGAAALTQEGPRAASPRRKRSGPRPRPKSARWKAPGC
ncbi:hypothetical protein [Streptomyces smyrnaeus]|uniref:hypothetical protein n=1 Tax=Streptomyces smyrnaeus TaxID=1387713 RepID=UPI0033D98439